MNTVLVWVLVTLGGYGGKHVVYSPPMPDLKTCEHLQKNTQMLSHGEGAVGAFNSRCVQIQVVITK